MSKKREWYDGNFRGRKYESDEQEKTAHRGKADLARGRRMEKGQKLYQDLQDEKSAAWSYD